MKWLITAFFAFLVLSMPGVWAELNLYIEPSAQTVTSGAVTVYNLMIVNNRTIDDEFTISVDGPYTEWRVPGGMTVSIDAWKNKTTDLIFIPGEKEGKYVYTARVTSIENPLLSKTLSFNLNVNLPPLFRLENLTLEKGEEEIKASLNFWTRKNAYVDVVFELKDSENNTLSAFSETGQSNGYGKASVQIPIKELMAGTYHISAKTSEGELTESFEIEAVHNVIETSDSSANPMYREFIVSVTNDGNIVEDEYTVTKTIVPEGDSITAFVTQPASCSDVEGGQECVFKITNIKPGETGQIVYRMDFWPSYAKAAASVIVIIILGAFYFVRISKPGIKKTLIRKGENEHMVVLEINGSKLKGAKDVMIKDTVSPLGEVVSTELRHHIKPIIRKTEAGTELIWKLGNFIQKEERLLTYRLRTTMEGSIKMPRAVLRFINHKGEKSWVFSNELLIE